MSNLKSDYDKFRETNHNKNDLPELKLPDGGESCESYCKSKGQKLNAEDQVTEEQKSVTPTENSLSDQPSTEVGGSQEGSVFGIEGDMHESNSITLHTSINNGNKLPYIAVPFVLIPIILGISYKVNITIQKYNFNKYTLQNIFWVHKKKIIIYFYYFYVSI